MQKHKDYRPLALSNIEWLNLSFLLLKKFNIIIRLLLKCFEEVNAIKQKQLVFRLYKKQSIRQKELRDVYDKAAILLLELTRLHAFESGNKRTAFLTTKKFVITNGERFRIPDRESNVKIMIGIRENYYSQKEIKEWIKYGKIKTFKR